MSCCRNLLLSLFIFFSSLPFLSCGEFCENGISDVCRSNCNTQYTSARQECEAYNGVDTDIYRDCLSDVSMDHSDCLGGCPCN